MSLNTSELELSKDQEEVIRLKVEDVYGKDCERSKYMESIIPQVKKWIKNIMNYEFEDKHNLISFSAYGFPDSKDSETALKLAKIITILYFIDDQMEDKKIDSSTWKWRELVEENANNIMNISPLEMAFKDILDELLSKLTSVQQNRLKLGFIDWIESSKIKIKLKDKSSNMTLEEYLDYRYYEICTTPFYVFVEYCYGIELQDEVLKNGDLNNYIRLAGYSMSLVNDLYSFKKEYIKEDVLLNGVTIIRRVNKCSLQEAFNILVIKAREIDHQMVQLKQRIINCRLMIPIEYLIGIEKLVYGSEAFEKICLRYTEYDTIYSKAHIISNY